MKNKIRVAVCGVGNCASSLIQGLEWYRKNPNETVGLPYPDIGGYSVQDIQFVVGFDVDIRKVDKPLNEAVFALPNCTMKIIDYFSSVHVVEGGSKVYRGPTLDGIAPHMKNLPEELTFIESNTAAITSEEYKNILKKLRVDVILNYMPVGSEEASKFYIENAIEIGVDVINCMPSYISTEDAMKLEQMAINNDCVIVGSDMRSSFGASRLSEILQGSMLDAGLEITQHIQTNMASGSSQGQDHIRSGKSANCDFLNMAEQYRLKNKHISKENVLNGQNAVRNVKTAGATMFAGPSLTVMQKPGGQYMGTDNKVANFDIIAYGWCGAKYELTARLSVQDSPNSAAIVADAIRYCRVAKELGVVGILRGPSAYTQKSPPLQMKTEDAKFECDAMARRIITPLVEKQLKKNNPKVENLDYTFQKSETDYQ